MAAPQRKVRDSLESAHSLESGVPTYFSQVLSCALRLDPARRMQTVPELMSALTDPNVANAMFERGDNQISTKKILGASLVVIFVLVLLLFWSLAGRVGGGEKAPAPTAAPTPAAAGEESPAPSPAGDVSIIPDLVGQDYDSEIKGSDLYQLYRIVMTEEPSSTVEKGRVISQEPMAGTLQTQQSPIIQIKVSSGPMLVKMPDIIGFTQDNASRLLDAEGIQYRMMPMENDGSYAAGCVAYCELDGKTLKKGEELDAGTDVITVYIAGARDATTPVPPEALAQDAQE